LISDKYFAVHGHFYQPPRVDPLSGQIPQEYGADPYANWNELIYNQCYLPNTTLRNFEKISFNIGATLSDWIAGYAPHTLQSIVQQENTVFSRYCISNGMAQPYFHVIMPLASPRDRDCLVHWGMREFEHRFGHTSQGMWLPETAVDLASLQSLADHGIQFTILAPWQAKDPSLDVSQPYLVRLPDGRQIRVSAAVSSTRAISRAIECGPDSLSPRRSTVNRSTPASSTAAGSVTSGAAQTPTRTRPVSRPSATSAAPARSSSSRNTATAPSPDPTIRTAVTSPCDAPSTSA